MEKVVYTNHWNKCRKFEKKRSLHETRRRVRYFESIKEPLLNDIEAIMGSIEQLEIIGSVRSGAAETDSDIDILIVTSYEFTAYEFETGPQWPLWTLQHALNAHSESPYNIQLFCLVRPTIDQSLPPSFFRGTMEQVENVWNQPWNPSITCVC